jgi:hypothetical protein
VGVTDVVAGDRLLSADVAHLCHTGIQSMRSEVIKIVKKEVPRNSLLKFSPLFRTMKKWKNGKNASPPRRHDRPRH